MNDDAYCSSGTSCGRGRSCHAQWRRMISCSFRISLRARSATNPRLSDSDSASSPRNVRRCESSLSSLRRASGELVKTRLDWSTTGRALNAKGADSAGREA